MTGIGTADSARLLLSIECKREHGKLVGPECGGELCTQLVRLLVELLSQPYVGHVARYRGNAFLGRINIRLHLAQRNGTDGQPAIAVEDRVVRVLPSLL